MKKNFTLFLCFLVSVSVDLSGQVASWNGSWSGIASSPLNAHFSDPQVATASVERKGGLQGSSSTSRYNSNTWTSPNNYLEFSFIAASGHVFSIVGETVAASMSSSATGPAGYSLFSSADGFMVALGSVGSNGTFNVTIPNDPIYEGLNSIIFRIVSDNTASNAGGTGGFSSFILNGSVIPSITCTAPPTIDIPPADLSVSDGQDAIFSIAATGASAYQWQVNEGVGWSDIPGATSTNYIAAAVTTSMDNNQYRASVTCDSFSTLSSVALLSVTCTPPIITTQPADLSVPENDDATFSVAADGSAPFTYQWQVNDGNGWVNTATDGETLIVSDVSQAMNGYLYRVVVDNVCSVPVVSDEVQLSVTGTTAGPCLVEDFNTGLPTSYYTGIISLPSGDWDVTRIVRSTTAAVSPLYSIQLESSTNANIIAPVSATGLMKISFSVRGSTISGAYQVNLSRDGGGTWEPAPGSPFTIGQTVESRVVDIPAAGPGQSEVNTFQIRRTGATLNIDDISVECNATPTPVTIRSFTAKRRNNAVDLTWVTAKERNNQGFEIERSADSRTWYPVGFVAAISNDGNSSVEANYSHTDDLPRIGTNFYRLKQVDFDGSYAYSAVRKVLLDGGTYSIYPNPAKEVVMIDGLAGTEVINFYDASGVLVRSVTAPGTFIEVADLMAGSYNVQIINAGDPTGYKLVIIR